MHAIDVYKIIENINNTPDKIEKYAKKAKKNLLGMYKYVNKTSHDTYNGGFLKWTCNNVT